MGSLEGSYLETHRFLTPCTLPENQFVLRCRLTLCGFPLPALIPRLTVTAPSSNRSYRSAVGKVELGVADNPLGWMSVTHGPGI